MNNVANAIEVENLCFAYGDAEVLHNVSFAVPRGSLTAVVGPNGGGKTTLLKLLLGEETPRFGTVKVLGEDPCEARRRVGLVPQETVLDADFPITAGEAVQTGLVARRVFGTYTRAEREAARAALARVGLADSFAAPYPSLSGGQRQRVAIARALVSDPELLLLDEPTANVDHETELALTDLFAELAREKTVVLVSHNLSIVAARATHILCVNHSTDMHIVGRDDEMTLEPIHGHDNLSYIRNVDPEHIEHLIHRMHTPHHAGCSHE